MRDIPIDDGSSHPEGTLSADGHLEVRGGEWRETELGQVERWRRQAPDLYAAFMQQTEEKVQQAEARAAEREQHQREITDLRAITEPWQAVHYLKPHQCVFGEFHPADEVARARQAERAQAEARIATLTQALRELRIDANRLCDRQLGGTYEDDCRRSIANADAALGRETPDPQKGAPR